MYYTTSGSFRGSCGHKHRYIRTAQACLLEDAKGCASQGGYTDRVVQAVDDDGNVRDLSESELFELHRLEDGEY